jgi:cation diffusion facilitator family transporter
MLPKAENIRLLQLTFWVGILLMIVKFYTWWVTDSNGILSDALESIINVIAGAVALFSIRFAARPRDINHPYGHGKIEFLSAGFEGTLIGIAGLGVIGKSVYNLFYPESLHALDLGILLTAVTGGINYLMGHLLLQRGKKAFSVLLQASGRHLMTDGWSSLGLLVGLALIHLSGWQPLDNLVAVIFGAVIIISGIKLVRTSLAGILDEADEALIRHLVTILNQKRTPNWIDVHNLRIIKYGNALHIDCHLTLPWYFHLQEGHTEVKQLEALINDNLDQPVEIFIHIDPCSPASCSICCKTDCPERSRPFQSRITWTLENLVKDEKHE